MAIEIRINDLSGTKKNTDYIGWSPRPVWVRQNTAGAAITVDLRNNGATNGGQVTFFPADGQGEPDLLSPSEELVGLEIAAVTGQEEGQWTKFFIAGKFDQVNERSFPSKRDKDTGIGVFESNTGTNLFTKTLMVRVRKNATKLTPGERDDFLTAIMHLNTKTSGNHPWQNFQNMHTDKARFEIHGRSCFLPWHRMYLLNLEREIQRLEISQDDGTKKTFAHVTIPYWDFYSVADQVADAVHTQQFMGEADSSGIVQFAAGHPLVNWNTNLGGINNAALGPKLRRGIHPALSSWDPKQQVVPVFTNPAFGTAFRTERDTLKDFSDYERFNNGIPSANIYGLEDSPHGPAQGIWVGPVGQIEFSPADPLFFLLHCNVDRLWAMWQWKTPGYRFDALDPASYDKIGKGSRSTMVPRSDRVGNFTDDTLWPWNGDDQPPRPDEASWGDMPASDAATAPASKPVLKQAIDYHGQHSQNPDDYLGFDYDDIPLDYPVGLS